MRKLYALLAFLCMAFALNAQDSLKPVGWATYPTDVDWATTAYEKMNVEIKMAPTGWEFDESTFNLESFWDSIGTQNEIKKFTKTDGGVPYEAGVFGGVWKAFYDADNLYVCLKYFDTGLKTINGAADSRAFEVMYQTKYSDRYEPGWSVCTSTLGKNQQYGRFLRLGGGKAKVEPTGITEFVSSDGVKAGAWSPGAWESNPNVLDPAPVVIWDVDASNTIWCTVQFNFTDHMYYLDDVFGTDTLPNRVAFDPTIKTKIAFDVKTNSKIDSASTGVLKDNELFWNSGTNDGFEIVYYNGYITFGTGMINTSVPNYKDTKSGVYLSGNILRLRNLENADITVYSTLGKLVKSGKAVSQLDLEGLKTGIYLVRMNNNPSAFKVFKQ
jgi:hypothetical protein